MFDILHLMANSLEIHNSLYELESYSNLPRDLDPA